MRSLSTLTPKETIELGNLAFRHHKSDGIIPYHSKKWKLHIFESDGKLEKVAIVDEVKPLMSVDDLWSKEPQIRTTHDGWLPYPQYNFIEITADRLIISHHYTVSIVTLLQPDSQYMLFNFLENHGFMGERADTF